MNDYREVPSGRQIELSPESLLLLGNKFRGPVEIEAYFTYGLDAGLFALEDFVKFLLVVFFHGGGVKSQAWECNRRVSSGETEH